MACNNNQKKLEAKLKFFDKLESGNWLGIVWGYKINSKTWRQWTRREKKHPPDNTIYSVRVVNCYRICEHQKFWLLHKFYESRGRRFSHFFYFQNCIEFVCSRWRLPSENWESLRQTQTETGNYYTQTNYELSKPKFNKTEEEKSL